MKILQNCKLKDYQFNYSNLKELLAKENLRPVLVKDLKINLSYIWINKNLLLSEMKKNNYQNQVIRNQMPKESAINYTRYKNTIKRLVKEKELWTKIM